jgi:hypothetical protein
VEAKPFDGVIERLPGITVKLAVADLFPLIVKVTGLVVPVTLPLQLLKV